MLNDWYQAIIDPQAPLEHAKELAIAVSSQLASRKIITLYRPTQTLTHISGKFAPGPDFSRLSGYQASDMMGQHENLGGMDISTQAWVNDYGIVGLDSASCPMCRMQFSINDYESLNILKEAFGVAGQSFSHNQEITAVTCPSCSTRSSVLNWQTRPHLGFCHLAFIFWNWPPFENWKVNIPALISETLGRPAILTYGRL